MRRSVRLLGGFALFLAMFSVSAAWAAERSASGAAPRFVHPNNNPVAKRASDDFYNQDYDRAIRGFESLVKEHPDDPFATNYLLSAVLFKEMYRIGALETESYANDSFMDRKASRPLDPAARARILELDRRAETQANRLLAQNPDDVDALYARGAARALLCVYMGMGEKAWLSGLRAAIAARRDHERVLELDPDYVDAKMVVGVHNYVIGSLSWPVRVSASIVGIGGNKQKGLNMLRQVANAGSLASPDAKIALALFLRREQAYDEALRLVQGMSATYPRSCLIALEYAHLLAAAGHGPESVAAYRQILTNYKDKKYPLPEPAIAAFFLGNALRGQNRFEEAAETFDSVGTYPGASRELIERAMLAAGEMYDTLQKRDLAINRYQALLLAGNNTGPSEIARQHMRQPYQPR
ncbi:MAG: tetratricopeptide repeat protein [Candidatus Korobacteraceae bacterium]|jgi:tetratricopeptide (TPR) repeat protein